MPNSSRWRRATALTVAGLALGAGAAACSAGDHTPSSSSAVRGAPAAPAKDAAGGNAAGAGGNAAGVGGAPAKGAGGGPAIPDGVPVEVTAGQRAIVYTGSITMRVVSVDDAAAELSGIATTAGGFIGADNRTIDAGRSTASLQLRVPAQKFTGVLGDISKLTGGRELSRRVSTQDVTQTVVDLDARIKSQQASVDRVRALLARAQSLSDITEIESQLTERESTLESMQAQKRSLDDETALSSVTVDLLGEQAQATTKPSHHGFWSSGLDAFVGALRVLLVLVGAVLPFALVAAVAVAVAFRVRRRRRAARSAEATGRGEPPAPVPPAPPAAPAI